jgi:hypothetical protein
MLTKKWCVGQPRFYKNMIQDPASGAFSVSESDYVRSLPFFSVVYVSPEMRKVTDKNGTAWSEVIFKNEKNEELRGWLEEISLEDVIENFIENVVPIPAELVSPDPLDAVQNLILKKVGESDTVKTNLCGEFCVAFAGGDDIETFLNKWKAHDKLYYPWAIGGNNNQALFWYNLDKMLEVYGHASPNPKFREKLTDPGIGFVPTPGRFKHQLETHYLIANVRIETPSGKLVSKEDGKGVGHWVVLTKVIPYGINRGRVEIYNPYHNRMEEYSYADFIRSVAPTYTGLWVKRPSRGVADEVHFPSREP